MMKYGDQNRMCIRYNQYVCVCAESENNEKEIYIRNVDERENAEMSLRRGERPYSHML